MNLRQWEVVKKWIAGMERSYPPLTGGIMATSSPLVS